MDDWISVKKSLPETGNQVLCFCEQLESEGPYQKGARFFSVDRRIKWNEMETSFIGDRRFKQRVTHWMPLPDEPKQK